MAKTKNKLQINSILGWALVLSILIAMIDLCFNAWQVRNATGTTVRISSLFGLNLFEITKTPAGTGYDATISMLRGLGYYFLGVIVATTGYGVYKVKK